MDDRTLDQMIADGDFDFLNAHLGLPDTPSMLDSSETSEARNFLADLPIPPCGSVTPPNTITTITPAVSEWEAASTASSETTVGSEFHFEGVIPAKRHCTRSSASVSSASVTPTALSRSGQYKQRLAQIDGPILQGELRCQQCREAVWWWAKWVEHIRKAVWGPQSVLT